MFNAKELACGKCGGGKHRLYKFDDKSIITKCVRCNNLSSIYLTVPRMDIRWIDGQEGRLCEMKADDHDSN